MHIPEANNPWFWHVADAGALTPWGVGASNTSLQEHMARRIVSVQSLLLGIKRRGQ